MNIADYWKVAPSTRDEVLSTVKQQELEEYAEEHQMLLHNGKLIKPEAYPCECELQSPGQCFERRAATWTENEREIEQCSCPCHRYYEPD